MVHTKRSERAQAEAEALTAARHPGVVELVDAADGAVRTRVVEGRTLSEAGALAPEEVAGLAAALASTLADLHDLGVVHGGLDATHVILTADGRPVLCSLGRSGTPADDVHALGSLVTSLLARPPADPPAFRRWARRRRALGPMLAPPAAPTLAALAGEAGADDPARRPSARALAAAITERVPTARLPRPEADVRPLAPGHHPVLDRTGLRRGALVCAPAVVVAVAVACWWALSRPARPGRPDGPAPAGPPIDARLAAQPVHLDGGVLSFGGARYALGRPGDVVALGRWGCEEPPTPVLLRPSTGDVFLFDEWAGPGRDVPARPLGRVEHATGVRAVRARQGCDHLEVLRARGAPVQLPVPGATP